ncbi:MAG: hypothetical protein WCD04_13585 [Terriglobia bacterium]|jgi:hypothetical protein
MSTEEELLDLILGERRVWLDYLTTLQVDQLSEVQANISHLITSTSEMVNSLEGASTDVQREDKKRNEEAEKSARKKRRATLQTSLRQFLAAPIVDDETPLRKLQLCTKTGAKVLLKGMFFKTPAGEKEATTVNDAKTLFQHGYQPAAAWNLHYVRGSQIVAGFGWDRPFLDEVFLLRADTKD